MRNTTALLLLLAQQALLAQLPYTAKLYPVAVEKDIPYGTATTFAGGTENLVLDLYKPIGDGNCQRPLLVMVHGGGFIAGTKADADVVQICEEMAARGYATASVHYRLGMHPLDFYEPYALCNDAINPIGINKCIYAADDMEFIRALYRATQDVKGAIRFLKGRHELDSTDVGNVFVGGSSAGAITALHAAFTDLPSEKPAFAGAMTDAPTPDNDLASCVPAPANPARPDLGTIEGDQNLNGHDASVQGVAEFMGGLFDILLLNDGVDTPAIYLYHRTDDLVVPSNSGPLFMLYPYCINPINLCQPLYTRPTINGSASIRAVLGGMGSAAPPFFDDILDSYGPAGGDDCLDDPSGHSIVDIPLRCTNLSGFFAPIIAANGNTVAMNPCTSAATEAQQAPRLSIYPNPVTGGVLNVVCPDCEVTAAHLRLLDALGQTIATTKGQLANLEWALADVKPGLYFLQISTAKWNRTQRVSFYAPH